MSATGPSSPSKSPVAPTKWAALGLSAAAALGGVRSASAQTVFTFTPTSDNSISYSDTSDTTLYVDVTAGVVSTTNSTNNAGFAINIAPNDDPYRPGKGYVSTPMGANGESVVSSQGTGTPPKAYVTPLNAGDTISAASTFSALVSGAVALSSTSVAPTSGFTVGGTYYLGFSFTNNSSVDYGWMNITTTTDSAINSSGPATITLNSFAYEDGGAGIVAGGGALSAVPEPANSAAIMGSMALVAGSVMMYRRRQDRFSRLVRV